jgi:hypothetical protein
MKNAKKLGMTELRGAAPDGELLVGRGNVRGNKLDGSLRGSRLIESGQEDGAVIGITEELLQRKSIVDQIAFVLFPEITHSVSLRESTL